MSPGVTASGAVDFSALKVALVHDWLTGMRGGEKVLEAIAELFPEAPIFTLFHFPGTVSEALEQRPIHTSFLQNRLTGPLLKRYYRHFLPLFPAAIEDFDLSSYDLIVSTSHCVAKGVIPGPDTLHLCYCHSPIRYAWDQEHQYFPKRRGLIPRIRSALLSRLRVWDAASAPRVDHFWANSSFVARRIERFYGRQAEVLHPPVAVDDFRRSDVEEANDAMKAQKPKLSHATKTWNTAEVPFALAVSALVPYKKLDLAIQACELSGIDLKIVGTGPELAKLRSLRGSRTELLGRVSQDELETLYRHASFFLQPGVEDFGIATVEALAAATPVVALAKGGVLDIVKDGVHGVLYSGSEARDAAAAIDKCRRIRFNPLELESRASQFSRARFARGLEASIGKRLMQVAAGTTQITERT